jgi:hypothetical protein
MSMGLLQDMCFVSDAHISPFIRSHSVSSTNSVKVSVIARASVK